jgi:hypothetical protein
VATQQRTNPRSLIQRKVGQRVECNGFPGTITRVCEWDDSLVEVRLPGGRVCVEMSVLRALGDAE